MRKIAIVTLVISLLFVFSAHADDQMHTISVIGRAEVKGKPDVSYITVYARADGILMVDAVKKADRLIAEIMEAVNKEAKIVKGVAVSDVSLGEKQSDVWRAGQKDHSPRPEVIRRIRITCSPEPAGVYKIIDNSIRAGAIMQVPSSVRYSEDIRSVVIYGIEKNFDLVDRVRQNTMNDAKSKADAFAALIGKKAGSVVKISNSGCEEWVSSLRVMGVRPDFPTEHIGTNPEEIVISHAIAVVYELQD